MQLDNSKKLKEQLEISEWHLAKERGTLRSQGRLAKRVKDDFQMCVFVCVCEREKEREREREFVCVCVHEHTQVHMHTHEDTP